MMSITGLPGGYLQAADQTAPGIHADMCFIAVKVFGLLFFLPFFVFDFPFMLYSPLGIRVMRPFAFLFLPFLIFVRVYIRNAVHTVYDLDAAKLHTSQHCFPYQRVRHLFKDLQLPVLQ